MRVLTPDQIAALPEMLRGRIQLSEQARRNCRNRCQKNRLCMTCKVALEDEALWRASLDAATRDAQVRAMRDEIDDFRQVKRVNGDTVTAALLDRLLAILDAAEPQE